jgi:hypothetical protein
MFPPTSGQCSSDLSDRTTITDVSTPCEKCKFNVAYAVALQDNKFLLKIAHSDDNYNRTWSIVSDVVLTSTV